MDGGKRGKSFPGSDENRKNVLPLRGFRTPNAGRSGPCALIAGPGLLRLSTVKQNSLGPFMFAVLVVSVCLLAASMPACASQVSDATRCRVVNLMPPSGGSGMPQRISRRARSYCSSRDGREGTSRGLPGERPRCGQQWGPGPRIAEFLRGAPANIAAMRKLSDSLEGDLSVHLSGFQKTFRILPARTRSISSSRSVHLMEGSAL